MGVRDNEQDFLSTEIISLSLFRKKEQHNLKESVHEQRHIPGGTLLCLPCSTIS